MPPQERASHKVVNDRRSTISEDPRRNLPWSSEERGTVLSVSDTCPGVRAGLAAGSAQSIIPYNRSGRLDGHSFRRIELLTGAPRRRRWSAAGKVAIVAESFAPGAVARRHTALRAAS